MQNSNFSIGSRFKMNDFSSIQSSSAPGFVPIPCPSHMDYSITNICKSPSCLQPLCPQCITAHVQLHQQTRKPAKIQNIINTRLKVIQQLAQLKFQTEETITIQQKQTNGNIDQFLQSSQKKLITAKKKVIKMVDDLFQEMFKRMDIIANAFFIQKQKRFKENNVKLAPLYEYVQRVTNYKQEMESDDYIPALLQLLNQPPRKPKVQKQSPIQNCGTIEINQKYLQDLKYSLQNFVKVIVTIPGDQYNRVAMNQSNYHNSNNMRFSRMEQSRQKQNSLLISQGNTGNHINNHLNSNNNMLNSRRSSCDSQSKFGLNNNRSDSRKKIFGNHDRNSSNNHNNQIFSSSVVSETLQPVTNSGNFGNINKNMMNQSRNSSSSIMNQLYTNTNSNMKNSYNYPQQNFQTALIGVVFNSNKSSYNPQIDGSLSYFRNQDQGILAYFQQNTKNYFKVKLQYAQSGFQRIPLQINFNIPKKHRSIITPDTNVYLLGGQGECQSTGKVYKIKKQYTQYQNQLQEMADMIYPRHSFAACYYRDNIFAFGGLQLNGKSQVSPQKSQQRSSKDSNSNSKIFQNQNQNHNNYNQHRQNPNTQSRNSNSQQPPLMKVLRRCQRFDIQKNQWYQIKQLPEHAYNFEVCTFNNMIIKFGGILQSGQKLHRVDIYYPQTDQWNHLNTQPQVPLYPFMGLCQINKKELMIFGGINPRNNPQANRTNPSKSASAKCYVLCQNQDSNVLEVSSCGQLYQQSSFDMAYLYKNGMMAVQYNQQKQKIIMGYRNKQWRFIGC